MSDEEMRQLELGYADARAAYERAKAATVTTKATVAATESYREETEKALLAVFKRDHPASYDPNAAAAAAGIYARAVADVETATRAHERAREAEPAAKDAEQRALKLLIGVLRK